MAVLAPRQLFLEVQQRMQAAAVAVRMLSLVVLAVQAVAATLALGRVLVLRERLIPEAAVAVVEQVAPLETMQAGQAAPVSSFFATKSLSRLLFRPSHLPAHSRLRLASPRLSTLWWRVVGVVAVFMAAVVGLAVIAQAPALVLPQEPTTP